MVFSIHILAHSAIRTLHHLETTSRLQLYPGFLYQKMTAYGFILESLSALIAAAVLAAVETFGVTEMFGVMGYRLIYAFVGALSLLMVAVLLIAYWRRLEILDFAFDEMRRMTIQNYLLLERILCERIRISSYRRGAVTEGTFGNSTLDVIRKNKKMMGRTRGSFALDGFSAAHIHDLSLEPEEVETQIERPKTMGKARTLFNPDDVRAVMREFQQSIAVFDNQESEHYIASNVLKSIDYFISFRSMSASLISIACSGSCSKISFPQTLSTLCTFRTILI